MVIHRKDRTLRRRRGGIAAHSTDASNRGEVPIGVVVPRSVDDTVAAIPVCPEPGAEVLVPRSATDLSGSPRAGSLADHASRDPQTARATTERHAREDASPHAPRSLNVHGDGREVLEGPGVDDATIGWRAACCCGWRGTTVHSRARWPSACGNAPSSLYEGALHAEWLCHLDQRRPW